MMTAMLWIIACAAIASAAPVDDKHYYLPDEAASKIVSVAKGEQAEAEVIVLTEAVATKETGPKEDIVRVHVPQRRNFQFLLRDASARDERTNHGDAGVEMSGARNFKRAAR